MHARMSAAALAATAITLLAGCNEGHYGWESCCEYRSSYTGHSGGVICATGGIEEGLFLAAVICGALIVEGAIQLAVSIHDGIRDQFRDGCDGIAWSSEEGRRLRGASYAPVPTGPLCPLVQPTAAPQYGARP